MYIVTFYSFKGGTGRTMAMVNVAAELATNGSKVLLVDFDLEAPGLDTYSGVSAPTGTKGIVDFVSDYLNCGVVPDAREYMYEPPLGAGLSGRLLIMPAGVQDGNYDERFKAIDWNYLYDQQEGFLLFEDLKEQWRQNIQPDYVLVDSRTGHTDVGGICTRQLPDAVAIFFFPNEQNRRGLISIVENIRSEAEGPLGKVIKTHFVMSNVPDLDDEEEILAANVERLRSTLKYDGLSGLIHHYNSLLLLDQSIFTLQRPRSRLAHEYRQLTKEIRRGNLDDRVGALEFLADVLRLRRPPATADLEEPLGQILGKHSRDGEILRDLARLRRRQRKWPEAVALLDQAVSVGAVDSDILLARAELNSMLGNREAAILDVYQMLRAPDAPSFDLQLAVRLLIELAGEVSAVLDSPSVKSLNLTGQLGIVRELDSRVGTLPIGEKMLRALKAECPDPEQRIKTELMLCLIGQGKFREAMAEVAIDRKRLDLHDAFNYAMAEWAETRRAPKDLFERALSFHAEKPRQGANYFQCLAIACWATGDVDRAFEFSRNAYEWMARNQNESFSCWSYLWVDPRTFFADIAAMDRMFVGEDVVPAYMARAGITLLVEPSAAEKL